MILTRQKSLHNNNLFPFIDGKCIKYYITRDKVITIYFDRIFWFTFFSLCRQSYCFVNVTRRRSIDQFRTIVNHLRTAATFDHAINDGNRYWVPVKN